METVTKPTTWTIADEIAYYERYGKMRFPIAGGSGETPQLPEGATLSEDGTKFTWNGQTFLVQSKVNELVGTARTEGKTLGKTEAEKEAERLAQNATQEELKEQGKFKDLYTQAQARITELEGKVTQAETDLASERLTTVRTAVAAKHKLPTAIADRLKGTTEAELEADAVELAKQVAPVAPVNTQNGGTNGGTNQNGGTNAGGSNQGGGNGGNAGNGGNNQDQKPKPTYAFQTPGEVAW